jgi:hypothetical protein
MAKKILYVFFINMLLLSFIFYGNIYYFNNVSVSSGLKRHSLRAKSTKLSSAGKALFAWPLFTPDMPICITADNLTVRDIVPFGEKRFLLEVRDATETVQDYHSVYLEGEFADSVIIDAALVKLFEFASPFKQAIIKDEKFRPLMKEVIKWYKDTYAKDSKGILLFDESGPDITGIGTKDVICISSKFIKNGSLNPVILFNNLLFAYMHYLLNSDTPVERQKAYDIRDNMFNQLPEGSRRWVAAEKNKRPELSFHYVVRAWQRQAFGDADKYLTQMIAEKTPKTRASSAGNNPDIELWYRMRKMEITEHEFLTNVDISSLSNTAHIIEDPREEAILHHYLERQFHSESHSRYLERVEMYKALLRPDKRANGRERFLQMFDENHARSLIFELKTLSNGTVAEKGILSRKDILMLVLLCSAMLTDKYSDPVKLIEAIDVDIIPQKRGRPYDIAPEDIQIIKSFIKNREILSKIVRASNGKGKKHNTNINAAFKRLQSKKGIYFPDEAAKGNIRWIADILYPRTVSDVEFDLFRENTIRQQIDNAA